MSIRECFANQFATSGEAEFLSPGRVNLIGEHIDYCGGLVLPMAINRGSRAVAAKNGDRVVRVYSERFDELREVPLRAGQATGHWSDFVVGVVSLLIQQQELVGVDLYVTDDISAGGLSSSASFALLVSHALLWAIDAEPIESRNKLQLAQLCQKVEHEFMGVKCGIMDQASIALGGVIMLDCADLTFKRVSADFADYSLLVMDTQHERTLAGSKYNERVAEITQILDQIGQPFGLNNLCELELSDLDRALSKLNGASLRKRLRHVVSENDRVVLAGQALESQQLERFGELMNQSHDSLHNDYEVTGDALNEIVTLSRSQTGCIGARMTGAGFGGCALALVLSSEVTLHNEAVTKAFFTKTGRQPRIFSVTPERAAGVV
jgi:galactokinase